MKLQFDFGGKRVLVTGSTDGIGREVAGAFHALGATVAVNGSNAEAVQHAVRAMGGGTRLVAAAGDLSDAAVRRTVIDDAIGKMGGIDILVNNPGMDLTSPAADTPEQYWPHELDSALKSAFFTAQACVLGLKKSRGCIVNLISAVALTAGPPGSCVHSAVHGALVQMTRMSALALAGEHVRVNAVATGWSAALANPGTASEHFKNTTPLGRPGSLQECAGAILYLAADFAGFTTGSVLVVDGGFSSGH